MIERTGSPRSDLTGGESYPSLGEGEIVQQRASQSDLGAFDHQSVEELLELLEGETPALLPVGEEKLGFSVREILTNPKIKLSRCTRKQLLRELQREVRRELMKTRKRDGRRTHPQTKRAKRNAKKRRWVSRYPDKHRRFAVRYNQSLRGRYTMLSRNCKHRGIPFEVSWERYRELMEGQPAGTELRRIDPKGIYTDSNIYTTTSCNP